MILKIIFFFIIILSFQFENENFIQDVFSSTDIIEKEKFESNFKLNLDDGDHFGVSVTTIGDLNNDGVVDLAVGAPGDDDGGDRKGAVWILFLDSTGKVKDHQKISDIEGNFEGTIYETESFGWSITNIGDLNNDGVVDLAVGTNYGGGGRTPGIDPVWILFLDSTGKVKDHQKISDIEGNFEGTIYEHDNFGYSLSPVIGIKNNMEFLLVGANSVSDGGKEKGAVWILFLDSTGKVKDHQKISDIEGNFEGNLDDGDNFGSSVNEINDLNNDGVVDIVIGAFLDDDGAKNSGAVWIIFMKDDNTVNHFQKISNIEGNFEGNLDESDYFGQSISIINDVNGDGIQDLVVGSHTDDDGGDRKGAVWILFLDSTGKVKDHQKISDIEGNFEGNLDDGDHFGVSVTTIGDLNNDGVVDLAVGAKWDDGGGKEKGAVWILFLDSTGKVKDHQKISNYQEIKENILLKIFEMIKEILQKILNY
jgi:hypothetical protein